jgi:hypothetical protein
MRSFFSVHLRRAETRAFRRRFVSPHFNQILYLARLRYFFIFRRRANAVLGVF